MIINLNPLTYIWRIFAKVIRPHLSRGFVHIDINYSIILIARFVKPFFKVSKKAEW